MVTRPLQVAGVHQPYVVNDWSAADDLLDETPEETPSSSAAQPPESPEMQEHTPSQPSTSQAVATRQLRPPEVRRPPDRYGDFV
ncbi:hypothetical protein HPB51_017319 [Rhipicephalus microplus]|uniref:Uncharacterized protein n=1 Tax=Rhipicephalus microplus TaxID=6941 RepID=A0A9J6ETJ0_RHIMP|nr:hypothetical protein HPB51_017319 [Rhipicephalus microplus]